MHTTLPCRPGLTALLLDIMEDMMEMMQALGITRCPAGTLSEMKAEVRWMEEFVSH